MHTTQYFILTKFTRNYEWVKLLLVLVAGLATMMLPTVSFLRRRKQDIRWKMLTGFRLQLSPGWEG
ncbi:hypothetical protein Ocin01_04574 [Orchesella cincta]|uniref:Uncharacterized protein n=1 Tax=Orchesella cincta TaxID=48709 RepID=A0A1D2NA01_ORCCI|nr:hypothetical protein Ocin01_04574 [Orchesella cincta]